MHRWQPDGPSFKAVEGGHLPEAEEEIFAQNGVIEDIIAIDVAPVSAEAPANLPVTSNACSPTKSMREEVVANIFDAFWPEGVGPSDRKDIK